MNIRVGKLINYLNNQSRAYVNTLLKEEEVTYGECQILLLIEKHPEKSQERLRYDLKVDKSAITRMIKKLVDKGYVQKTINTRDRRNSSLSLTIEGTKKLEIIHIALAKGNQRLLSGLAAEEQKQVYMLLKKMCQNIEEKRGIKNER